MAKLHFLGTCSGTEPMPGMHHTSLVIETNEQYYWFDAGENCAYTAYLSGIDVLKTRAIFLSHMHMDHIGGLANLFCCIRKMISLGRGQVVKDNTVEIYAPRLDLVDAIKGVVAEDLQNFKALRFETKNTRTFEGLIHEDENLRVTARHNTHLKEDGTHGWHSYSFLIEVEGKRVVLSGDVGAPSELDALLEDGCDLLVMETGHHKVKDVCEYAQQHHPSRLRFSHHGREIINDRPAAEALISTYPLDIKIAYDGLVEEI
ncbi:MAG: MBL fold metallo-hydrolase [Clostridia bacterium]|nr:MBL fold metallo-hydrolase [Clostridia bacterium]